MPLIKKIKIMFFSKKNCQICGLSKFEAVSTEMYNLRRTLWTYRYEQDLTDDHQAQHNTKILWFPCVTVVTSEFKIHSLGSTPSETQSFMQKLNIFFSQKRSQTNHSKTLIIFVRLLTSPFFIFVYNIFYTLIYNKYFPKCQVQFRW